MLLTMTKYDPSDDDKKLFRESMRSVTPLKQKNSKVKPEKHIAIPPIHPPKSPILNPEVYFLSSHYTEVVGPETILSYSISSLPKKRLLQLKRGEIRPEGRLDLHGNTIVQAQDKLCQFITHQCEIHHRCVLIIHGKGSPTGEAPVLKNHVNHWLKQLPQILAFHSALPRDGGSGALYVLLYKL